jgi:flagellar assembly protein FliH
MVTRIHRFDFGTLQDFRGPIVVQAAIPTKEEDIVVAAPPPPPTFTEQDMEAARLAGKKQGYNEGFTAGQLDAKKQADQRTEDSNRLLLTLGDQMADLEKRYMEILQHESRYLSQLVLAISRKVAGEAINTRGEESINAIIARCMPVIFSKPKLIVEMHPDIFERTLERIETYLRAKGFEGEVQFKANTEMGLSDVKLDWGTGQVNHNAAGLWAEVETLIERVPLELTFANTLTTNQNTSTGE